MAQELTTTIRVQNWIARLAGGDEHARKELLNCACHRLLKMTKRLQQEFPLVSAWEQEEDICQNAGLRLFRALEHVELNDARHFFRLAALQIRRELLEIVRRYRGTLSRLVSLDPGSRAGASSIDDPTQDPDALANWGEFHEQIGALPEEYRDVFDLLWYHGLKQDEVAELLKVDVRTVRRRWREARLRLHAAFQGEFPLD